MTAMDNGTKKIDNEDENESKCSRKRTATTKNNKRGGG